MANHIGNEAWIVQEDNAPYHVSRAANQWKETNDIPVLSSPHPSQSPNFNIIKNVEKVKAVS